MQVGPNNKQIRPKSGAKIRINRIICIRNRKSGQKARKLVLGWGHQGEYSGKGKRKPQLNWRTIDKVSNACHGSRQKLQLINFHNYPEISVLTPWSDIYGRKYPKWTLLQYQSIHRCDRLQRDRSFPPNRERDYSFCYHHVKHSRTEEGLSRGGLF
jgi:hypothetical protein